MVLGLRRDEYYRGTSSILATIFQSNTDVQVPYRVPVNSITHDKDCRNPKCVADLSGKNLKNLVLVAQKAMKQMTGYFGGYISKRQKSGRFELENSIKALPLFQNKLQEKKLQSAGSQLAQVVNKMFTTLEGKGILRSGAEEFLQAAEYSPHDELA